MSATTCSFKDMQEMFTGIIEAIGTVKRLRRSGTGAELVIEAPIVVGGSSIGDSIAVDGACLTVRTIERDVFGADLSPETLAKTTLGALTTGSRVNLERALAVGDRLGGHFVLGHVDCVGTLVETQSQAEFAVIGVRIPEAFPRYLVPKGSVAVDGISLTVVEIAANTFTVWIIPETLRATTMGAKPVGSQVNLEFDLLAKQVVRYLEQTQKKEGLTEEDLKRAGFT